MTTFYGKYRGKVTNNSDPKSLGRLQVSVPTVLGDSGLNWAMPCVPYAGRGVGFFAMPPIGANVWVEFESGDPDHPIWTGCFWGEAEAPAFPALALVKLLQTESIKMELNDTPSAGGFTLEVLPPAVTTPLRIVCDSSGVEITNGIAKIQLSAASVSINNGALEIT